MGEVELLTDEQYLQEYIKSFYFQFEHEIAAIKDCQSLYIAATKGYVRLMGFENPEDIVGKGDEAATAETAKYAKLFYQQDRHVESLRREITCLDNHNYAHGFDVFLFNKHPVINPHTDNILATRLRAHRPLMLSPLKISLDMQHETSKREQHFRIGNFSDTKIKLTTLQHIVLYLTLSNLSQREIEEFTTSINCPISEESAKNVLRTLRQKFKVNSKEALIAEAMKMGLHVQIPAQLFKKGSYILNGYEIVVANNK